NRIDSAKWERGFWVAAQKRSLPCTIKRLCALASLSSLPEPLLLRSRRSSNMGTIDRHFVSNFDSTWLLVRNTPSVRSRRRPRPAPSAPPTASEKAIIRADFGLLLL